MSVISKISVGGTVYDLSSEADIASPSITGSTNNTGETIPMGQYFYLNGELVRAKTDIENNATFTLNTNYELVPNGIANEIPCLIITQSSVSSLPITINNANITSDMVCINSILSNPSAQTGDWTLTTSSGSVSISGTISGTTDITLYLMKSR